MKNTFKTIAGYEEEKEELIKISKLINNYDEFIKAGGKLPKGVLLSGPAGTGKSTLAKALIEESNCAHFTISYNDVNNDDEFLDYIKKTFEKASKSTPCIVFIDELDKLIGQQSPFYENANNAMNNRVILNEINRYNHVDGMFIIMVANKRMALDRCFVRSGRIDKIIEICNPNEKERKAIFRYYAASKKMDTSVDEDKVAKLTKGLSGADIESLINNASINTFLGEQDSITMKDIMKSYYDIVFKTSSKDLNIEKEDLRTLAFHEAGHLVLSLLTDPDSVSFASIKPRGNALGFVSNHGEEVTSCSKEEFFNRAVVCMGGRAAESMFLNKYTAGCCQDLVNAKSIIGNMVRSYGMFGLNLVDTGIAEYDYMSANSTAQKQQAMEQKEDEILEDAFELAKNLLSNNKKLFDACVDMLLEKRSLYKEDIEQLIEEFSIKKFDSKKYRELKVRVGMYGRIDMFDIQNQFSCGYYLAKQYLEQLIKDKYVSDQFNNRGYSVLVD